jgi:hypothetical protein
VSPPSAQSPFAPCGCDPMGGDASPISSEVILLLPRSYGLIRQSQRILYFGFPRWRSLRRLSSVPAARRTFPTLSPRIFPWIQRALTCFFRCVIGLPHKELGRLPAISPLETTSCGPQISERQIFLYVPASNFVLPPRSSLPLHTTAGQPELFRPGRTCFVTSAPTGYANRPNSGN